MTQFLIKPNISWTQLGNEKELIVPAEVAQETRRLIDTGLREMIFEANAPTMTVNAPPTLTYEKIAAMAESLKLFKPLPQIHVHDLILPAGQDP